MTGVGPALAGGSGVGPALAQGSGVLGVLDLAAAIQSFGPLNYWQLRGASPGALTDLGSLGQTLGSAGAAITFDSVAGSDGFNYPSASGGVGNSMITSTEDASQSLGVAGLTIGCLLRRTGDVTQAIAVGKWDGSTAEWYMGGALAEGGDDFAACRMTAGTGFARWRDTNTNILTLNTWKLCIARFNSTATASPSVNRVNGVNITGTTGGSGTGAGNTTAIMRLFGGPANQRWVGQIAHAFVIAGELSDADCQVIEDGARADGWPV